MPLIGTKLKLNIHLTKSPKRDNIYKLCLYTLEEHKCLVYVNDVSQKLAEIMHQSCEKSEMQNPEQNVRKYLYTG